MNRIFAIALLLLSMFLLVEIAESMRTRSPCGNPKCSRRIRRIRRLCTRNSSVRDACVIRKCSRGKVRCEARPTPSPSMTPSNSPSPSPSSSPLPTPATGHTSGDPHIKTYDDVRFDCQGAGEFILTKSDGSPGFEVQGRFRNSGTNPFTLSSGLAAVEENAPTLQFSVSGNAITNAMTISGCPITAFVDGVFQIFDKGDTFVGPYNNTMIVRSGNTLTVHFPSGLRGQVTVKNHRHLGCYLSKMVVTVPGEAIASSQIVGLFGTPNGPQSDDFTDRSGNTLTRPSRLTGRSATTYCIENWSVTSESESLFTSEGAIPVPTPVHAQSLTEEGPDVNNAPEVIQNACDGRMACLIDGILVDEELAKNTLDDEIKAEELANVPLLTPVPPSPVPVRFLDTSKVRKKVYDSFYTW